MDPNIAYVNPDDAVEAGTIYGPDSFTKWRGGYERFDITPREFIDAGDALVVPVRFGGRARHTGIEVEFSYVHVLTIQNRKTVRMYVYETKAEALEAVGLRD